MDKYLMAKLLDNLALSPATSLTPIFAQEIRNYLHTKDFLDMASFVRTLRDNILAVGGCSDYVISVLDLILQDEPQETPEQTLCRRQLAGLVGLDDDEPMDTDLEITKVEIPRSNPSNSWPPPKPISEPSNRRTV
jgi:hypothetical protein